MLRVLRAADVSEVLAVVDMLSAKAALGLLDVWMNTFPDVEAQMLARTNPLPNQLAPARLQ